MHNSFAKRYVPWNKGTHGLMTAWNKGLRGVYKPTPEAKAKSIHALIGPPVSEVTREKLRRAHSGKVMSASSRQKMSIARKGKPAWNRGIIYPSEVREKMSLASIGKNAGPKYWNWQGGKSSLNRIIRHSAQYKTWRRAIFERDDYRCFDCGKRGGNLEAHHIYSFVDYPRLRFLIENGITLCRSCHRQTSNFGRRLAGRSSIRQSFVPSAAVQ